MPSADDDAPLPAAEVRRLFADLADRPALILAVSGGPDSTALLWLAAQWQRALPHGPRLVAVTVDHGLRPEARREAAAVAQLARKLDVAHVTLRWRGRKPGSGLQAAARSARYRLLAKAAKDHGARHVLTAHTLDDQAETVLLRLTHGSGIGGLAAMARAAPVPGGAPGLTLVRPLLDIPKTRLVATLRREGVPFTDDPSNRDPRFTRVRLRAAMPALTEEGLSVRRLAQLARRAHRADAAIEAAVEAAAAELAPGVWSAAGTVVLPSQRWGSLPAEIGMRLLGRAIGVAGSEGPVELGKLEALYAALAASSASSSGKGRFRRTLAGALITRTEGRLVVERAPPRRTASKRP